MNGPTPESKSDVVLHDLLIEVLGAKFSISTNEDPELLNKVLAQFLVAIENTRRISEIKDPLKLSILTGFLLCDEFNKLKTQVEKEQIDVEQEINRITRNLIDCIDHVMEEINPLNE